MARRAEALAANGRMEAAFEILSLVPGDTSEGAAVLKDRLLYSGAVGSDANKAYSSTTATAAYGQSTGQVSSVGQAQPIQTVYSTYGSTYGNGQQYSYPYNANGGQLGSPSAWQAPTTYQPMQPPVGSAAPPPPPPPPSAPPTTFQPMQPTTNAPPPPMAIQASIASAGSAPSTAPIAPPPPPTVYQPAARSGSGVASPGSDNYYAQHQQHQMQPQSQPQPQPAQAFQTYSPVTAPAPAPGISSPRYGLGQQQRLHPQAQPNQAIPSPSPSPHPPSPKPQGPPADVTLLTADTSAVPADLKSVVSSFIGLYQKCEAVVGANVAKRRELDDASRKLGGLVWRMNQGQVSGGVASKLQALCAALDAGEYVAAGHVQVQLTTSHWDECASWLTALKRLIKMRQMAG